MCLTAQCCLLTPQNRPIASLFSETAVLLRCRIPRGVSGIHASLELTMEHVFVGVGHGGAGVVLEVASRAVTWVSDLIRLVRSTVTLRLHPYFVTLLSELPLCLCALLLGFAI